MISFSQRSWKKAEDFLPRGTGVNVGEARVATLKLQMKLEAFSESGAHSKGGRLEAENRTQVIGGQRAGVGRVVRVGFYDLAERAPRCPVCARVYLDFDGSLPVLRAGPGIPRTNAKLVASADMSLTRLCACSCCTR